MRYKSRFNRCKGDYRNGKMTLIDAKFLLIVQEAHDPPYVVCLPPSLCLVWLLTFKIQMDIRLEKLGLFDS